jgi:probable HAF family extracellular repeat protein
MPSYTITEIAAPSGFTVYPTAINNNGAVVGGLVSTANTEYQRAFFWRNGQMQVLPAPAGAGAMLARDMNDADEVAGWYATVPEEPRGFYPGPGSYARAFRWSPTAGLSVLDSDNSAAFGINASGDIVGWFFHGGYALNQVALWKSGGTATNLGVPSGRDGVGVAINGGGQVAASGFLAIDGPSHSFLWDQGFDDLMAGRAEEGEPRRMNDASWVVGSWTPVPGTYQSFLWSPLTGGSRSQAVTGGWRDLAIGQQSAAYGVNNAGHVVGESRPDGAYLWVDGAVTFLTGAVTQNPGWVLDWAMDINDVGQIVGIGRFQGQTRGFRLDPPPQRKISRYAVYQHVISGQADGPIIVIPPVGPGPGPGPGPAANAPLQTREALVGMAVYETAALLQDANARETIQRLALDVVGREIERLPGGRGTPEKK